MSTMTEIETRTVIDERLRRAREQRPGRGVRPHRRFFGTRPPVTGPLQYVCGRR